MTKRELKWGDILFGEVVTPENWCKEKGSIIEFNFSNWMDNGVWELVEELRKYGQIYKNLEELYSKLERNYRPIFPYSNWAAKDDWTLWYEIVGEGKYEFPYHYSVDVTGLIYGNGAGQGLYLVYEPEQTVKELNNAILFSKRLREKK